MCQYRNRASLSIGLLVALTAGCVCLFTGPTATAQSVYPDLAGYTPAKSLVKYQVTDRDGVWFSTGVGQICAIGDDGSYGCSGRLAGAPAGENEVAWFPGDPFPRLYNTGQPRFDSGAEQTVLVFGTLLEYRGSTCAVNYDHSAYCIHGTDLDSQMLVGAEMTFRGRNAQPIG